MTTTTSDALLIGAKSVQRFLRDEFGLAFCRSSLHKLMTRKKQPIPVERRIVVAKLRLVARPADLRRWVETCKLS